LRNVTQVDYRIGFPGYFPGVPAIGYILAVAAMEAMKEAKVVATDKIAVSREMVPLSRIDISDEQITWAERDHEKGERRGCSPIQADGMPDEHYAKELEEMRKVQDCN